MVRSDRVSSPAVTEALARARERSDLNAFAWLADHPAVPVLGPLAGVPLAVKDNTDVAGVPTTCGSRHFAGRVAVDSATCVSRLVRAGAVVIGKTVTHEFAYGTLGDSSVHGPVHNPSDPSRITGGSSAGSAAAVAAGIVPLALASDTGGSARIPASLCGVYGFKPTTGIVPTDGVFPLSPSLDTVGLMASSADLLAQAWEVLSESHDDHDRREGPMVSVDQRDLAPVDAEVEAAFGEAVEGLIKGSVRLPALPEIAALYDDISGPEAAAIHHERMTSAPELFQPDVGQRLEEAARIPGWRYVNALERRAQLRKEAKSVFEDAGFLLLPTTPVAATRIGQSHVNLLGEHTLVRSALLSLTKAWSVLGWPAVSVPGLLVTGLPVGLQIVGPPGSDRALLAVAKSVHKYLHHK